MSEQKCAECGRTIPPDEIQIVRDQMTVALAPLVPIMGEPNKLIDDLLVDSAYCAACYRRHDDESPLREWARQLAENPLEHPAMFRWHHVKKGDNHVDD